MTIIAIRPIQNDDTEKLVTIWLEASSLVHNFLGAEKLLQQSEQVREIYLKQAENWVITEDGKPVGFIGLLDQFIGGLFISPQAHGRGFGRQLLDHALLLKKSLALDVYALNTQAHNFYLHNGFVETARQETDSEGLPFAIIHMRRDL